MPTIIDAEETFRPGEAWVGSVSPAGGFSAVFEDDGATGYFYAGRLKPNGDLAEVIGALQIYNVENITDRDKDSVVKIGWTPDGAAAVLLLNDYPHAVFDFKRRRAACRTGFPPMQGHFGTGRDWDETLLAQFR